MSSFGFVFTQSYGRGNPSPTSYLFTLTYYFTLPLPYNFGCLTDYSNIRHRGVSDAVIYILLFLGGSVILLGSFNRTVFACFALDILILCLVLGASEGDNLVVFAHSHNADTLCGT